MHRSWVLGTNVLSENRMPPTSSEYWLIHGLLTLDNMMWAFALKDTLAAVHHSSRLYCRLRVSRMITGKYASASSRVCVEMEGLCSLSNSEFPHASSFLKRRASVSKLKDGVCQEQPYFIPLVDDPCQIFVWEPTTSLSYLKASLGLHL